MHSETEFWQVEVKGQVYHTNIDELRQWISDGAVLRDDKVKRGNLRWLEAGRIPSLISFFNAKDLGTPSSTSASSVTYSNSANVNLDETAEHKNLNVADVSQNAFTVSNHESSCANHFGEEARYECDSCASKLCGECPNRYGSVRTCPNCGSFCTEITKIEIKQIQATRSESKNSLGFGFVDFGKALKYPFKFKTSFVAGGTMFAFFTLGQTASAIGGIFMICAAIFCAMLSNMLTFGILANTVENFSQGKIDRNFMPSFDDFELWKDVIQPFFLSIGAYLVSFGILIIIVIGAVWYVAGTVRDTVQNQSVSMVSPQARRDLQSARSTAIAEQVRKAADDKGLFENGEDPDQSTIAEMQTPVNDEEKEFQDLQEMIDEHRKGQLTSIVGEMPEDQNAEFLGMLGNLAGVAIPFVLLAFIALLWGAFFFPAACLVAGYTRSFSATINPMNGLDTIRRLGFDYAKILGFGIVLIVGAGIVSAIVSAILSPFNMPMFGNIPAKFLLSFITFYISIVFSVSLGFAMYRNMDRLKA